MRTIEVGDRGEEVADIQRRLALLGYDIGASGADGTFGSDTENAVKRFQENNGLPVTGIVTDETWRCLVEAGYSLGDRLLYLRAPFFRGADVERLQLFLNKLGFNTGSVDAVFGPTTEKAIREFQRSMGLVPDGIVGDSTLAAFASLRSIIGEGSSGVFPDPHRASAISAISGRSVAIEAGEGACTELAERVGNLLEILGANVLCSPQKAAEAELSVGFAWGESCGKAATDYESDAVLIDRSKKLALSVQKELSTSLGFGDGGVHPRRIGKRMPSIVVKPPLELSPADSQGREIFHQKIAVAVFDAIKSYLEGAL